MTVETGKQYHTDQVHFLRKAITYADDGSTVSLGWLPARATVIDAGVVVETAFDGGTTNTLDIGFRNAGDGTAADTDEFATDLALGTAGRIVADEMATAGDLTFPGGAEVVGVVTSTASATAGAGTVYLTYIVDNT